MYSYGLINKCSPWRTTPITFNTMHILVLLVFSSLLLFSRGNDTSGYNFICFQWEVPCGCSRQNVHLADSRMLNGQEAVHDSWSMLVSIRLHGSDKHTCGGTVLNESYVLTSATCVAEASIMGITVATDHHSILESDATVRQVDGVFIHPNYTGNDSQYLNDIAVLHLAQPLNLGNESFVRRSCIAQLLEFLPDPTFVPSAQAMLVVIGWSFANSDNRTRPTTVQQALIYAAKISDPDCLVDDTNHDFQFCAKAELQNAGGQY
jgi:hypothetical protein